MVLLPVKALSSSKPKRREPTRSTRSSPIAFSGEAGQRIVIEEYMTGEEASIFAITDGIDYDLLATAQDHKRIFDGDRGKNTGGMGAYAPAAIVTPEIIEQVKREIIEPTLKGLRDEGRIYRGILYIGVMISNGRARVVEFNVRFGDPEAEVVLPLLDGDLAEIFLACAEGHLAPLLPIKQFPASAVTIVMASQGYPDSYQTGEVITGLDDFDQKKEIEQGIAVFHGATKLDEHGRFLTSGGRVLSVTAVGYDDDLRHTPLPLPTMRSRRSASMAPTTAATSVRKPTGLPSRALCKIFSSVGIKNPGIPDLGFRDLHFSDDQVNP